MKVKLDENLPESLIEIFAQHGHQAITVSKEGLAETADEPLEERLFVTLDLDFSDIRTFLPNTHPGIIVVRPKSKGQKTLRRITKSLLQQVALETLSGALTIVNETHIRIRRERKMSPT